MTESDIKFEKLITEMEKLLLDTVPKLENTIVTLKNQERNQGVSNYNELQIKEAECLVLRNTYRQNMNDLKDLDRIKAKSMVKKIIWTKRQLEANYTQSIRDANKGPWEWPKLP